MIHIKIGDFVGRPNFPHNIGEVKRITRDYVVVDCGVQQGSNGKHVMKMIKARDIELGIVVQLNIVDGEIVK